MRYTAEELNTNSTGTNKLLATINSLSDVQTFVEKYIKSNGKFDKSIRVGDKIQINDGTYNKEWIIVGFNTQNRATSQPHISLIPTDSLGNIYMNSSRKNSGGYVGSAAFDSCNSISNTLAAIFSDYLLTRNELLGSSGFNTYSTVSKSVRVNLLNEMQVFGNRKYSVDSEDGYDTTQLPGFRLNKVSKTITSNSSWWLRSASVGISLCFCSVTDGNPYSQYAEGSYAFRPLITIGRPENGGVQ